jgi:hypothetical protein
VQGFKGIGMSDGIVKEGGGKLRPPSTMREVLALALAGVIGLGFVQMIAPIVESFAFIDELIREHVRSLGIAMIWPLYGLFSQVLLRASGEARTSRPDMPPWFVTGLIAGVLLFAFNQFASLLGAYSGTRAVESLGQTVSLEGANRLGASQMGALYVGMPMTLLASLVAGVQLNKNTRQHVFLALALSAGAYVLLTLLNLALFEREQLTVMLLSGPATAVAFFMIALFILAFGAVGVIVSGFMGDRSLGRLTYAARRLNGDERNQVIEGVLRKIESRA